ncbi:hypothetical protein QCA50_008052 [Cerrena zonata]|uniref:Uncharacterized protein n=1 Tax=Cerrena zonata TaxID=2478898 RepID=A0AAW0GA36_9APHY
MESITHKKQQEELHQAEIRRQIAALQAQLVDVSNTTPQPPKKRTQEAVLAPASPSPKRRKLDKQPPSQPPRYPTSRPKVSTAAKHPQQHISKPAPSTLVSKLASITSRPDSHSAPVVNRSSGFSERPPPTSATPEG